MGIRVGEQATRASRRSKAVLRIVAATSLLVTLASCGDFWQNPNGTSTGTTSSTTSLSAASSSVTVNTADTLTANVSPTAATGTVTFYNNGTTLGSAALSSGTATYSATFAAAGTETLTATYGGNSTYASSTSSSVSVTVTAAAADAQEKVTAARDSRETNLVLDPVVAWPVHVTTHLHNVAGVVLNGLTVENIDDDGHCVFYSGSLYFAPSTDAAANTDAKGVYSLAGGGFLAPEGTPDLSCE
jgi:hypothetical protein